LIDVVDTTPFTVEDIVFDAPPVYERVFVVLLANNEEACIFFTSPVVGSVTSIGFPAVPVAKGFKVKLFIFALPIVVDAIFV
jgi:hypothetical protein